MAINTLCRFQKKSKKSPIKSIAKIDYSQLLSVLDRRVTLIFNKNRVNPIEDSLLKEIIKEENMSQKTITLSISQSISISPMYSYSQEFVQPLYFQSFTREINNLKKKVKKS